MEPLTILRDDGLLSLEVIVLGFDRGWIGAETVAAFATEAILVGDEHPVAVELAMCEECPRDAILPLLHRWSGTAVLAPAAEDDAFRRWVFAHLKALARSGLGIETTLDRLEELYAELGYPELMRALSRYYVPDKEAQARSTIGPCEAFKILLEHLAHQFARPEAASSRR